MSLRQLQHFWLWPVAAHHHLHQCQNQSPHRLSVQVTSVTRLCHTVLSLSLIKHSLVMKPWPLLPITPTTLLITQIPKQSCRGMRVAQAATNTTMNLAWSAHKPLLKHSSTLVPTRASYMSPQPVSKVTPKRTLKRLLSLTNH